MMNRTGVAASLLVMATIVTLSTGLVTGGPLASELPALELRVLTQSIHVLEEKHAGDRNNYVVGHALADRYIQRFEIEADLADLDRAEAVARAVMRFVPDSPAALARLSYLLLARHEFEAALRAAKEGVESDSTDQSANAALFDAALAIGEPESLDAGLRRLRPGSVTRQLREARWLESTGQLDDAFRTLNRACDRLADSPSRKAVVAWCLARLGDIERERSGSAVAARWYARALAIEPGYRNGVEGLANLAYAREDWVEAGRLYATIATEAHPDLYLRLAEVAEALGDAEGRSERELGFLRATETPDGERLYARELAIYLVSQSDPNARDRALSIAQADVARRSSPESLTVLAWVHLKRGDPDEALAASDRAVSLGTPGPTDLYVRGCVLQALGRSVEAAEMLASATQDPGLLRFFAQRDLRRALHHQRLNRSAGRRDHQGEGD